MARLLSYVLLLAAGIFVVDCVDADYEEFETRQRPSSCLLPCLQRCSIVYGNPSFGGAPSQGGGSNTGIKAGSVSGKVSNDGIQSVGGNANINGGIKNGKRDTIDTRQASNLFTCYIQCSALFGGGFPAVVGSGNGNGNGNNVGIDVGNVQSGGEISNDGIQVVGDGAQIQGGIKNGKPKPSSAPSTSGTLPA